MSEANSSEEPNTERPARLRRRWWQYRLRSLLLLVLLVGGLLAAWRYYLAPYREQANTLALIEQLGGRCQWQPGGGWIARLSGSAKDLTLVNLADCDRVDEYLERVSRLPCLEVLVVGGPNFGDEQLARLKRLRTLRWLVLDSTEERCRPRRFAAVSDAGPHTP